jgi:hypothetical protein
MSIDAVAGLGLVARPDTTGLDMLAGLGMAAVLGMVAGLHAASWGAYKDSPYEGFRWRSYVRSVVLGGVIVIAVAVALVPVTGAAAGILLLGIVYALERLATEWWKSVLRNDDQSAYDIPMRLGFRGRPVRSGAVRFGVGVLVAGSLAVGCWGAGKVGSAVTPPGWTLVLLGGAGGWLTAVGGAWKDAPIEGFGRWKFLRSPMVATAWAVPLSPFVDDWVTLAFAAAGFAVASIETYKSFLTGGRPPGKFATKPVRFELAVLRRRLAGVHAATWAALAVGLTVFAATTRPDPVAALAAPDLAVLAVAALAGLACVLVLLTVRRPVAWRAVDHWQRLGGRARNPRTGGDWGGLSASPRFTASSSVTRMKAVWIAGDAGLAGLRAPSAHASEGVDRVDAPPGCLEEQADPPG